MANTIMLYLAPLSALLLGSIYLWAIYHSIKTRAWKQIAVGTALGFFCAIVSGWTHPLAFLLLTLLWTGTIHAIAERIKEWR